MPNSPSCSTLVVSGFVAGLAVAFVGTSLAVDGSPKGMSGHSYGVSIDEVRQNLAFGDEFTDHYTRSVTLSDGSTRTIALRPVIKGGHELIEFTDSAAEGPSHMGPNGTTTHGKLMVSVTDLTQMKAAFFDR